MDGRIKGVLEDLLRQYGLHELANNIEWAAEAVEYREDIEKLIHEDTNQALRAGRWNDLGLTVNQAHTGRERAMKMAHTLTRRNVRKT